MFLSWQTGAMLTPSIDLTKVMFLYDPATNTDLVTGTSMGNVLRATTSVDSTITIDGNSTLKESSSASGATLTFPTPLDLDSLPEWTIEWSSLPTSIGTGYSNELLLNWNGGPYVGARWPDGGFGNRLQFSGGGFGTVGTIWRVALTNSQAINKLWKYAMVYKDGKISVYQNGVKQTVANGTGAGASQDFFVKNVAWQPFTYLTLGWINSTYVSWLGNYGRVRISSVARYTSNYTPTPF